MTTTLTLQLTEAAQKLKNARQSRSNGRTGQHSSANSWWFWRGSLSARWLLVPNSCGGFHT